MADAPERIRFERAYIEGAMAHYTMDGLITVVGDEFPPEYLEYVRADLYRHTCQLHVDAENRIAALEQENEDLRLGYVDLLKSKAADSVLLQQVHDLRAAVAEIRRVLDTENAYAGQKVAYIEQALRALAGRDDG